MIKRGVQVCKLCVWTRNEGALFKKLQDEARGLMSSLANLCDERYQSLVAETGGSALLAFRTDPKNMDGLIAIRRQDHPEVLRKNSAPNKEFNVGLACNRKEQVRG
jgi:hypothetical protein